MIHALHILYLALAGLLALIAVINILRAKTPEKALNHAILLVPLLLRALLIK